MTVCVKHLQGRLPVAEIILARAAISLLITRVMLKKENVSPWGNKKGLLFIRGVLGTTALFCVFKALELLPLGSATVIQYTYPTFTALGGWLLLNEKLNNRIWLAVILGWIGIIMVVNPFWITDKINKINLYPVFIALMGAVLTSLAYICVRKLSQSEHQLVIVYYFPLISIPLTIPFVLNNGVFPNRLEWIWLLGIGILTQLGQVLITKGLSILPAANASAVNYSQVIFAAIWGIIIFNEQIDFWLVMGSIFILSSTLISIRAKTKEKQAN